MGLGWFGLCLVFLLLAPLEVINCPCPPTQPTCYGKIFIGNRLLVHVRAANSNIKPNIIKATLNSKNNKYAGYCLDACEFS